MRTKMRAAAAAAAATLVLSTWGAVTASADTTPTNPGPSYPAPRIISVGTAKYRPATDTVSIPVTYRCQNRPAPMGTQHFIIVEMGFGNASWSAGNRNGPGSTVRALCTGQRITHTLILQSGSNFGPEPQSPPPVVQSGYQITRVRMDQTASHDWGGWYLSTGPKTSFEGSVWLRSPQG